MVVVDKCKERSRGKCTEEEDDEGKLREEK